MYIFISTYKEFELSTTTGVSRSCHHREDETGRGFVTIMMEVIKDKNNLRSKQMKVYTIGNTVNVNLPNLANIPQKFHVNYPT